MIRLAQHTDIEHIAQMMLELKQHTGWRHAIHPGYNRDALVEFVGHELLNPASVVYVCSDGGEVVAFCGCSLGQLPWPPYLVTIGEWGWAGPARESARCWRACVEWGKKRGAGVAYRVTGQPGRRAKRVTETVTWEVL